MISGGVESAKKTNQMLNSLTHLQRRGLLQSPRSILNRAISVMLVVFLASVCAHASDSTCQPNASLPAPEIGQPLNIAGLYDELLYYKCSGAYEREFHAVIEQATVYLLQRVKDGDPSPLALVLDIDETSLSNWEEIEVNQFAFFKSEPCELQPETPPEGRHQPASPQWMVPVRNKPCGDDSWKRSANLKPIMDTVTLFNIAKSNNVHVFFISGRGETMRKATEQNLTKAGYLGWTDTDIMLRPNDDGTVEQFKTTMRQKIKETMHYTIIANVGDQYSDLRGQYAEQVFKVPNPFYFIP